MNVHRVDYPATVVVHWATGPVNCCEEHARGLLVIANHMGWHVVLTQINGEHECTNCVNENKSGKPSKR